MTAVIVAHDGAAWLPHVIDGLLEQTRPVQRVVAVDTGSRDRSGAVLAAQLGQGVVFGMDRATGYGAAVAKALQHKAANGSVPGRSGPGREDRVEWIWLLHDDCEPAPDALEQLLRGAAETPNAGVLGPKVMDWSDRDVLLEAGVTIDTVGRRITGIEPREVDQGQHDGDRDSLAVSSAGMLVRRDVWDEVRGFDTSMGLFREDIDFCWRVHAAGYRVRVITDAVVFHLQAMTRRRRAVSVGRRQRLLDRRNSLLTLAGNLPLRPMLRSLAGNVGVSFLRVLFFLLAKRVTAALDEIAAVASVLGHPLRLLRVRQMRAPGRRAAYGRLRAELPPGRSLRRVAEFAAAMSGSAQQDTAGSHHATEDPADDDFLLTDSGIAQRILTSPSVLLFLGLLIVTCVAERSLLGAGSLSGGALLPASDGATGLWRVYLEGFHPTGIGSPTIAPPYLAVVAILATVLLGKAWLAVDLILLGSVPIAGMAAFLATRRITTSVPVRVWAAATYALIPVATGAISAGRLGTAAAFALIPLIGLCAGRMFSQPPRIARRAAWATGLAVAVGAAFVPLLWPIVLLAAGLAALALRRAGSAVLRNLAIVAIVPPVLLVPWTFQLAAHPAALLLEAGAQQPGLASSGLPTRSLMLLSPGGPGLPPFWVTAGLAVAALLALLASRRRILVMSGWTVAVLGLLVAVLVSRVSVQPADGGPTVTAWPGLALAVTAAGLLLAAAAGGDSLGALLASGRSGLRRVVSVRGLAVALMAVVACSAPVLAGGFWLLKGVSGPIGPATGQVVPAFVAVSAEAGHHARTLVLRQNGAHVSYLLLRGSGPTLGDADLTPVPAAERALGTAVASLVAPAGGQAVDQGRVLSRLDIGFVLVRAPVNQELARTLDAVTGLRPVSMTASLGLWRLGTLPSRISVVEPNGAVVPVSSGQVGAAGVTAPAAGGTLLVAEPAGGWHATLGGRPLTAVVSPAGRWAQAFRLPSGGGTLTVGRSELGHDVGLAIELLAALVVAALALPGVRAAAEAQAVPAGATNDATADVAAGGTPPGGAPGSPAPARGTGDPAAGRGTGRPARTGDRRGGKGRAHGRGAGRRGRRPDSDQPVLPGPQRVRHAAGQETGRLQPGVAALGAASAEVPGAGAAGAGAAGVGAAGVGAAGVGAAAADWAAGSSAAPPAGQAASRFTGEPARRGTRPDPTGAGGGSDSGAFDRDAADAGAFGRAGTGAAAFDRDPAGAGHYGGRRADSGAFDRGAPGAGDFGGSGADTAAFDRGARGSGALGGGALGGGALGGGADTAAFDRGALNDAGFGGGYDAASQLPGRDAGARSPTGAWPYPDEVGLPGPGGLPGAPGARGAGPVGGPAEPGPRSAQRPGPAGTPSGSRPYGAEPGGAVADDQYSRGPYGGREYSDSQDTGASQHGGGQYGDGQYADGQYADGRYADGQYTGASQYADGQYADGQYADGQYADGQYGDGRYADGQYTGGGQYGDGRYADGQYTGDGQYGDGRYADGQYRGRPPRPAGRPPAPAPQPSAPAGDWPPAGQPEAPYAAPAAWQGTEWRQTGRREAPPRPPDRPGPSAPSDGWPRQEETGPSWPNSQPASAWPHQQEQPSSWPANEPPSSWPAQDQSAAWPAAAEPPSSRPGSGQPREWSSDPTAGGRRGGTHAAGRSGPAGGQEDRRHGGQPPDWAGSGDPLEPLPSADMRHGAPPPDPAERSRPRWPAPERDDPDEGDAW